MTLRRARGTALIGRNTHTRLGAELCTPVPIIGATDWLVHIGKLRGFNYLAALAKPRLLSGGGVCAIRNSLFPNKHPPPPGASCVFNLPFFPVLFLLLLLSFLLPFSFFL